MYTHIYILPHPYIYTIHIPHIYPYVYTHMYTTHMYTLIYIYTTYTHPNIQRTHKKRDFVVVCLSVSTIIT